MGFPKDVQKQLGSYVYALIDPRDKKIFYIGKASSNDRAFNHLKGADEKGIQGSKNKKIKDISDAGYDTKIDVIRHGLSDNIAYEIEAAVIDAIGIENLTNEVRGHSIERGRFSSNKIIRIYGSETVKVSDLPFNAIGFFINKTYFHNMSAMELYDATRQFWTTGKRARYRDNKDNLNYPYAFSIVDGVIVAVYEILDWYDSGSTMSSRKTKNNSRSEFVGQLYKEHDLINKKIVDDNENQIPANQKGFVYFDSPSE